MKSLIIKTAAILILLNASIATADEVADAINEGLTHYKKGDLSGAASQLDYAATLIKQQQAGQIVAVFPEPLAGWEASEAEGNAAGMIMGGGISANRNYSKGDLSVDIELMMDSPMMQSIMPMFSNPAMIAMSGAKLIKIQGHKAMLRNEDDDVEITLIVNNNAMFTIRGNGVKETEVKAYAEAIKLDKLN